MDGSATGPHACAALARRFNQEAIRRGARTSQESVGEVGNLRVPSPRSCVVPKQAPIVDYDRCKPTSCDAPGGVCAAAKACTHQVMIQEDPFDPPLTLFLSMCVGCGHCAKACPLDAIRMG